MLQNRRLAFLEEVLAFLWTDRWSCTSIVSDCQSGTERVIIGPWKKTRPHFQPTLILMMEPSNQQTEQRSLKALHDSAVSARFSHHHINHASTLYDSLFLVGNNPGGMELGEIVWSSTGGMQAWEWFEWETALRAFWITYHRHQRDKKMTQIRRHGEIVANVRFVLPCRK